MKTHILDRDYHYHWNSTIPASATVNSGDRVIFECRDCVDGQLTPESTIEDFKQKDVSRLNPMIGPVFIEDAEPGDVVEVEFLSLEHHGWGWAALTPTLEESRDKPSFDNDIDDLDELRILKVGADECLEFFPNVRIPINPSVGIVGLAPALPGSHSPTPPRRTGGNMDNRFLRSGAKVYLPVEVAGGLLSIGDGHLCQGDGQASVYAVEAPLTVTTRIRLHKDWRIDEPRYVTAPGLRHRHDAMSFYATSSFGKDLAAGVKSVQQSMVAWLQELHDLSHPDACFLTGLTGNVVVSQTSPTSDYHVSMQLPRDIFM
ncbi:MAG: acetamidase/formamidase family protein [Pseudomonadota bacterium]